jgi:hypothetical protein
MFKYASDSFFWHVFLLCGGLHLFIFLQIHFINNRLQLQKNKVVQSVYAKSMTEKTGCNNAWPRPVFWRGSRAVCGKDAD